VNRDQKPFVPLQELPEGIPLHPQANPPAKQLSNT
jgi:hypothetical protein